jgi:hypothetical protein
MCNLHSLTKRSAIRDWFGAVSDLTGNLPLFLGISPDQMAPLGCGDELKNGDSQAVANQIQG